MYKRKLNYSQESRKLAAALTDRPRYATTRPDEVEYSDGTLVYSAISQKDFLPATFQAFKCDLKIGRPRQCFATRAKTVSKRNSITKLTAKSCMSLSRLVRNSKIPFVSQICLTYHEVWPMNGRELKADLNNFLTQLRYLAKKEGRKIYYLWVLEFQKRGAPHFHLLLSVPPDRKLQFQIAKIWHRIAGHGSADHLAWHLRPGNFLNWDTRPGYLTKYLEKADQKNVPYEFEEIGRFWGASRNLIEAPRDIETADLLRLLSPDEIKSIVRWIGKWHERKIRQTQVNIKLSGGNPVPVKSRVRYSSGSVQVASGARIFHQIANYFFKLEEP